MTEDQLEQAAKPTREEMSVWDVDRKLQRIQQTYIKHPQAQRVRMQLDLHWKYGLRMREGTTSYIVGYSRCGKSETLKRFTKDRTGKNFPKSKDGTVLLIEGNGVRVVYLDTMNGATPRQASISMLKNLFNYHIRITENEAAEKLIHFFSENKIDLFIIDEGQKMIGKEGTGLAADKFVNWLLSLENAGCTRIVVSGGPELQNTIDTHPMLRDRKDSVQHIRPFPHGTSAEKEAFKKFLKAFDDHMPYVSTPIAEPALQDAVFYATRGRPGRLAKLLEKATQIALMRNKDKPVAKLDQSHLAEAFDMIMLEEAQMFGVNPFDHDGDLPTIPVSIEQEEADTSGVYRSAKATRTKASRILKRPK